MEDVRKELIGAEVIEVFDSYTLYYNREKNEIMVRYDEKIAGVSSDELARLLLKWKVKK